MFILTVHIPPYNIFYLWSYINVSDKFINYELLVWRSVFLTRLLVQENFELKFFVEPMANCIN